LSSLVIIGSGNVATCLGNAFVRNGVHVKAVYSLHIEHANELARKLNTSVASTMNDIPNDADFYLLAVKDAVIKEVSDQLNVNGIVIHCSGTTNVDALNKHNLSGVIWPVQTLTKDFIPDKNMLPLCVEGINDDVTKKLLTLCNAISDQVIVMNSEQRKYAHLAAVIANNMSNHLFDMASVILKEHGLSFDLLRPIIKELANKLQHANPYETQTGPAKRGDLDTIQKQLEMLNEHPRYREMYKMISESILSQNK